MEKKNEEEEKTRVKWKNRDGGDKNYFDELKKTCDEEVQEFFTRDYQNMDKNVEEEWESFKSRSDRCLRKGLGEAGQGVAKNEKKWYEYGYDKEVQRWKREARLAIRAMKRAKNEEDRMEFREEFKSRRKLIKKRVTDLRNQKIDKMMRELEIDRTKDPRTFWIKLKAVAKWKVREKKMPSMVVDLNGKEVKDEAQMTEVWRQAWLSLGLEDMEDKRFDEEYARMICEEGRKLKREEKESDRKENDEARQVKWINAPILLKEVRGVVARLKKGKATGVDGIITELFKYGGERMMYCVWSLLLKIWREEEIPDDWSKGVVVPIFKKEDRRDPFNYRGISLLSVVGKMFTTILSDRLMVFCEENDIIADEQGGFRKGRGCPDQLFALTEVLNFRKGKKTCCCFIDIKKAYDTVFRDGLWVKLHQAGIQGKMWRMITSIYNKVQSCVLVEGVTTRWFEVEVGVRQGCVVSPIFFSIFVDGLARKIKESGLGVEIEGGEQENLGLLMYADDIVLIAKNEKDLQNMIDIVVKYSHKWRFELNSKKTEIVIFGKKDKNSCFG